VKNLFDHIKRDPSLSLRMTFHNFISLPLLVIFISEAIIQETAATAASTFIPPGKPWGSSADSAKVADAPKPLWRRRVAFGYDGRKGYGRRRLRRWIIRFFSILWELYSLSDQLAIKNEARHPMQLLYAWINLRVNVP